MRYEAPRVGRVLLRAMVPHCASARGRKVPRPSVPKASQRAGARRRIRVGRRAARRRVGAAKLGPADRRTIGGAYRGRAECPVRRQRKANWMRDPKETFPGCKALKNHETRKESCAPRGVAVGPRSTSAAITRAACPAPAEASAKPLPGLDEERRRRYGASGRPFVPGAARVKATCYFFCDFT